MDATPRQDTSQAIITFPWIHHERPFAYRQNCIFPYLGNVGI